LSLFSNTTASNNTAVGMESLCANTTGCQNTALGDKALKVNTTGCSNVAIGHISLDANTTGDFNTAVGKESLTSNTTGTNNTALGRAAASGVTTGEGNVAVGFASGDDMSTGDCNIAVGYRVYHGTTDAQYEILIGSGDGGTAFPGAGNCHIKMGKRTAYITNNFASNANWSHSSQDNTSLGLDFINDLRTVTYNWKAQCELDPSLDEYDAKITSADSDDLQHGLIAQEVKASMDKLGISSDFGGWNEQKLHPNKKQSISESMFVIPLIKAVQELSEENKDLKSRIEALESN